VAVTREPDLDPPISVKTLERWEKGGRVKRWRLKQLARIYGVPMAELRPDDPDLRQRGASRRR
jgi:hypothetical protein